MEINNWYKLTFEIEANFEEIIIWKLNDLGIFSYAFEILLKNKNKKKVIIWLPTKNWRESLRVKLENDIKEVLNKNNYQTIFFEWNVIQHEDWVSSWKKYWGPELVIPSTSRIDSSNFEGIGSSILKTITASPLTIFLPTCIEAILTLWSPRRVPNFPIIPGISLCLVISMNLLGETLTGY